MELKDIITREVVTTSPDAPLMEAARVMSRKSISSILVLEAEKAVGIISERDFLRIYLEGKDRTATKVGEVMSSPVITADISTSLDDILKLMRDKGIRRLAITEAGKLAGIITETDLIKAMKNLHTEHQQLARTIKFSTR
ncbi:MAG: CBS domain-containing protein [Candidatus Altiarchaeota archaeon]